MNGFECMIGVKSIIADNKKQASIFTWDSKYIRKFAFHKTIYVYCNSKEDDNSFEKHNINKLENVYIALVAIVDISIENYGNFFPCVNVVHAKMVFFFNIFF